MALLRHLLCGLVVFCLIMPVNAQPDPDEFRCPAKLQEGYCTLNQVEQPHNTASNARISHPLMIIKHCARANKESGKGRDILRDLQDLASEKFEQNAPEFVIAKAEELKNMISGEKPAPKEVAGKDAPKTVDKTITGPNTAWNKRGTHDWQRHELFNFLVLVCAFVCWCILNNPFKNGWIVSFHGLAWVPCISSNIIWIDEAQTGTLPIRDKIMIKHQLHRQMPTVRDSGRATSNKVYRNATASPGFTWYRLYIIIACFFGVTWSNAILYCVLVKLALDMFVASGWTGPAKQIQATVQPTTTTFWVLTWSEKFVYFVRGIANILCWVSQLLLDFRNMDSEFWQKF